MTDIPDNSSTSASLSVGSTVNGTLENIGDHDWYKIQLFAGQEVTINLSGSLPGLTLEDPFLTIRDSAGTILFEKDDINPGIILDSKLSFAAPSSGTFYIDVGAFNDQHSGSYQLSVQPYAPPPVWTNDQIAHQMANVDWGGSYGFNVTQGGSISVNLTGLTAAGQTLAREALALWADIIGVKFPEVSTGGQITFDDNEEGAWAEPTWSGEFFASAHVNISADWLANYGTGLNSYSFQVYLHEIGHALGLGHPSYYDETLSYRYDALFANDGWPVSVMSYFDQQESGYYANRGFSVNFAVTPMAADILGMALLYGLATTTRTGDTTYGFNSNAGRAVYNASLHSSVAYTIFDSGGTDTLDYSGYTGNQLINLNPETFSNVGWNTGNVSIARGVVIENAIGGSGWDILIGNSANNLLDGRGGTNSISYEAARGPVTLNASITGPQNTGSAGLDTLRNYTTLIGSPFDDTLTGRSTMAGESFLLRGGDGNDTMFASSTGHSLFGDAGDDTLHGAGGSDVLDGGAGNDTLRGGLAGDTLHGGAGNDSLDGGAGGDWMAGETGDDIYWVDHPGDSILERWGEGTDTVYSSVSFSLSDYDRQGVEILVLTGSAAINGSANGGANTIHGNDSANVLDGGWDADTLVGNGGDDTLVGGLEYDTLTGGSGSDTFRDTAAGLNGDTITDLVAGEKIVITDASLPGFAASLSGSTLTFTGGSVKLGTVPAGRIVIQAAAGGGVELYFGASDARHDFNGDGRSDVLWRNTGGELSNWLGQANGGFVINDANAFTGAPTSWQVAGTGDFNGDGRDDILWRSTSGQVSDWLGKANGGFVINDANAFTTMATQWNVAGTGDFNGDGRDDILWRSETGQLTDWLGQPNGGFLANDANALQQVPTDWQVGGTGDFNGDGRDDLLWRSHAGQLSNWLGQANGGFVVNDANAFTGAPTDWHVVGVGDFNGDGRDDILWRSEGGHLSNWLGQPNGGFAVNDANAFTGAPSSWHVASVGDYNGDGRDDILWRSDAGELSNWLGQSNGGFAVNDVNAFSGAPTSWLVQSPDTLWV